MRFKVNVPRLCVVIACKRTTSRKQQWWTEIASKRTYTLETASVVSDVIMRQVHNILRTGHLSVMRAFSSPNWDGTPCGAFAFDVATSCWDIRYTHWARTCAVVRRARVVKRPQYCVDRNMNGVDPRNNHESATASPSNARVPSFF